MKMDSKMVFVLFSFTVAVAHCADLQSTVHAGSDEENRIESSDQLLAAMIGDGHHVASGGGHEPTATTTETAAAAAIAGVRSARQMYQPFGYQNAFPQRRAYRGPKKRPSRTKSGRRPRPHRRRPSGPPSSGRYRRLPGPVRAQQLNYIDADYFEDDAFESGPPHQSGMSAMSGMSAAASPYVDYVEREFDREQAAAYAAAVIPSPLTANRPRKRPAAMGGGGGGAYVDEPPPQVVHVPVLRVIRPAATTTTTAAAVVVDPMEKLRQLVHEAMDEHFSNRHQDLYAADGGTFDNKQQQRQHVYSAKYKRQPVAADKAPAEQRTADAVRSAANAAAAASVKNKDAPVQVVSYAASSSDAEADGSDDRLTLAEISAYMGAKPAETVLSAGGHRYVLSDALQQSYRPHQQQQQLLQFGGGDDHQYLRYLSPFEAMYELPASRWTYKK